MAAGEVVRVPRSEKGFGKMPHGEAKYAVTR
jgi:hypothetical protein